VFSGNARFAGQNAIVPTVVGCQLGLDIARNASLELTSAGPQAYIDFGPINTDYRTRIIATLTESTLFSSASNGVFCDNPLTIVSNSASTASIALPASMLANATVLAFDEVAGRAPFYTAFNIILS
jgi:hypothetical protein